MLNTVGPTELLLLFVIALLILGPERLPKVASQIGRWVGRARRTANHLRHQLEREIAINELNKPPARPKPKPKPAASSGVDATGADDSAADNTIHAHPETTAAGAASGVDATVHDDAPAERSATPREPAEISEDSK